VKAAAGLPPERPKRMLTWSKAGVGLPHSRLGEGEVEGGEGGYDGGFCAEDEVAERGFVEIGRAGGGKFGVGPTAFRADGQDGFLLVRAGKQVAQRSCFRGFRQEDAQASERCGEGGFGFG
jgi:hypothetical protein